LLFDDVKIKNARGIERVFKLFLHLFAKK
jgi:hypothetical protein